ncbi:hypothetical protein BACSTE_03351 [Bacteroides stercoris ATCC 43183]|uniref:Uncharacterized protein n=1 Tax=Bacteroides stercoris ATCC 43183 TaxID=449673 RepID=B0NV14_BACSE|nr:hypothetical protein BACSTE_03351 [Bacteroides stercoris ATCC 43183]
MVALCFFYCCHFHPGLSELLCFPDILSLLATVILQEIDLGQEICFKTCFSICFHL